MNELNGNEFYYYLDQDLPTNSYQHHNIETGDIMLFGSSCLVIFYESLQTNYSHSRNGKRSNPDGLKEIINSDEFKVTIFFRVIIPVFRRKP